MQKFLRRLEILCREYGVSIKGMEVMDAVVDIESVPIETTSTVYCGPTTPKPTVFLEEQWEVTKEAAKIVFLKTTRKRA